jgi:hypothetical protein
LCYFGKECRMQLSNRNKHEWQENEHLPGNDDKRQKTEGRSSLLVFIVGMLIVFGILLLIARAAPAQSSHFQHDVTAQFEAVKDWISEQITSCTPILPSRLDKLVQITLHNPTFDKHLSHWKTISGAPRTQAEPTREGENYYWEAGSGSEPLSCSSQLVDISTLNDPRLAFLPNISFSFTKETQLQGEQLMFAFLGQVDYGSVVMEASALIRRPPLSQHRSISSCGTRNHFCDITFNDHVWLEIEYLVSVKK